MSHFAINRHILIINCNLQLFIQQKHAGAYNVRDTEQALGYDNEQKRQGLCPHGAYSPMKDIFIHIVV